MFNFDNQLPGGSTSMSGPSPSGLNINAQQTGVFNSQQPLGFTSTPQQSGGLHPSSSQMSSMLLNVPSSNFQIETANIHELSLKNPHVSALYDAWKLQADQILADVQMQQTLFQQNQQLQTELQTLRLQRLNGHINNSYVVNFII
jgi:hypothetical protein